MGKVKSSLDKTAIQLLEGCADYAYWRLTERAYLICYDPLLLGLEEEPLGASNSAITKCRELSAQAEGQLTLLLSEAAQARAIEIIDDNDKTVFDLWKFLLSTYTASNEQAIPNPRIQLDQLLFVDKADWDENLNNFNYRVSSLTIS